MRGYHWNLEVKIVDFCVSFFVLNIRFPQIVSKGYGEYKNDTYVAFKNIRFCIEVRGIWDTSEAIKILLSPIIIKSMCLAPSVYRGMLDKKCNLCYTINSRGSRKLARVPWQHSGCQRPEYFCLAHTLFLLLGEPRVYLSYPSLAGAPSKRNLCVAHTQ